MTLAEFLLARIDEDAATAHHTLDDYAAHKPSWEIAGSGVVFLGDDNSLDDLLTVGDAPVAQHIARHDPARVLAECDAKRRIVALHDGEHECVAQGRVDSVLVAPGYEYSVDPTLLLLALPYADHPDCRDEWKP